MSMTPDSGIEHLQLFATSLGIGLLIGLERERQQDIKAGLRTFALVAVLGCISGLLTERIASTWIIAAGLFSIAAMMTAVHLADPQDNGDPGTTSIVALMLTYTLGAAVWFGYSTLAVILAIATTLLLFFKQELHGFSKALTPTDLRSILQFGVLSLVILPILPDQNFGPYQTLNPQQIWWMVVLVSGVSLAGYAALRFFGARHGATLVGLLGGLVSSTATTMVFSRHARADVAMAPTAASVILLANLVVMVRLSLVCLVLAPTLFLSLATVLGCALLSGLVAVGWARRGIGVATALPLPEVTNPTELKTALGFGAIYAVVLLVAAALQDYAGNSGLYFVALVSGLTDVDPITLSSLRLYSTNALAPQVAVMAISLAVLSNLAVKSGLVIAIGGAALAKHTVPGLAAVAAGLIIGLYLVT